MDRIPLHAGVETRIKGVPCLVQYADPWEQQGILVYSRKDGKRIRWLEEKATEEDIDVALEALDSSLAEAVKDWQESKAADQREWWY